MNVNTIATLDYYNPKLYNSDVVVVIDVLRASTTMVAALQEGAKSIIPCSTISEAFQLANNYPTDVILGGEENCVKPLSFNLGNSPREYTKESIDGKHIIFTSRNGAKAVVKAKCAQKLLLGSIVNGSAISDYLNNEPHKNITILCAGTRGSLSYEDTLAAGKIITHLSEENNVTLNDFGSMAALLYQYAKGDLVKHIISNSEAAKRLERIGLERDISFCALEDSHHVIPKLFDGKIIT
ncbi:2-phosphosulfolactate phosphatase [Desulfitispora alkaliphila]|uniref:2-phosphosulfolactate phosphatase n=1 Tax=Desulfitispora alkaliphila TaxID=622674 RepID=UPI003D20B690